MLFSHPAAAQGPGRSWRPFLYFSRLRSLQRAAFPEPTPNPQTAYLLLRNSICFLKYYSTILQGFTLFWGDDVCVAPDRVLFPQSSAGMFPSLWRYGCPWQPGCLWPLPHLRPGPGQCRAAERSEMTEAGVSSAPVPAGRVRLRSAPSPAGRKRRPGGRCDGRYRPAAPLPGQRRARCRPPPAPRRAGGWNRGCPPSPSTARPPPALWSPSR